MTIAKYALITGCGDGGIGHALAKRFRGEGFTVSATILPHEARDHLTKEDIQVFNADVTSDKEIADLFSTIENISHERLDVLVNNAEIYYTMPATDTEIQEVEKMFAVNVFGSMRMVRFFHRPLVAIKGTIVNIGSIGGIVPYIYGASYNATKAALHHYENILRAELKLFGVQVVNIISGEIVINILRRDASRNLPEDSLYRPLNESFKNHVQRVPKTITSDQYAHAVIKEVLKSKPAAWFWYGARTAMCRYGDMFLPRTYWDDLFWKWFDFDALVKG